MEKRIEWIDLAKGVAIFLMVFGHVLEDIFSVAMANQIVHMAIYSFHMPFFFMLSGMVFSDEKYRSFKTFFTKKFLTLIVPSYSFVIITIIINAIKEVMSSGYVTSFTTTRIVRTILQYRVEVLSNYWFLPTLFFGLMIMWFVHRFFSKGEHRILISILISVVGAAYIHLIAKPLPFSVDNAMLICIFLEMGYQLKGKISEVKRRKNILFIVSGTVWLMSLYVSYKCFGTATVSLAYVTLLNPILYFIAAISGSIALLLICTKEVKFSRIKVWGKIIFEMESIVFIMENDIL